MSPIVNTHADHGDACRMTRALDVIGDTWSLVIARELVLGPKRFSEIQAGVSGITPGVLTARLRALQAAGVVERCPDADGRGYQLTEWGLGLEAVIVALGTWYSARPDPTTTGGMTPDALVLALRTTLPPRISEADAPAPLRLTLRSDDRPGLPPRQAVLWTDDGRVVVDTADVDRWGEVTHVSGDPVVVDDVFYADVPLDVQVDAGRLTVEGDAAAVAPWVALNRG